MASVCRIPLPMNKVTVTEWFASQVVKRQVPNGVCVQNTITNEQSDSHRVVCISSRETSGY